MFSTILVCLGLRIGVYKTRQLRAGEIRRETTRTGPVCCTLTATTDMFVSDLFFRKIKT